MATIVNSPPQTRPISGGNGRGGWKGNSPVSPAVDDRLPAPSRTGIWVGLAAITMSFAAFTSALVVREGSSATDWQHLTLPPILYFNTSLLVLSSLTLELARRRIATFFRGLDGTVSAAMGWLLLTLGLGLAFVGGQYAAWLRLKSQGLFLATSPNSSFFYVLTGVHALHVLGGLGGLLRVIRRMAATVPYLRRSTLDATSYYWHFMGILWLYLLMVLWMRI
ncbi:MAG TPA: cytochrome c oxidase subunit 3 [Terriglobales bacterium]